MKTHLITLSLLGTTLCGTAFAAELETDEQRFSYSIGYQIGESLKRDGLKLDVPAVMEGVRDVLNDAPLQLTPEEMQDAMDAYRQKQADEIRAFAEKNKKAGQTFLAKNAKQRGVETRSSGLQYQILKKGNGPKPKTSDTVVIHYRATRLNGHEFDSTYNIGEPLTITIKETIAAWQEALPLMRLGGKWKLFVPAKLAYGAEGVPEMVGPNETLIYEIELLDIR